MRKGRGATHCTDLIFTKSTVYIALYDVQVTTFWTKVLTEDEKSRLVRNIAGHLKDAAEFIQQRAVRQSCKDECITVATESESISC